MRSLSSPWKDHSIAILLLFVACALLSKPAWGTKRSTWIEETFEDFVDGTFDDGGVQLYATSAGDIRFINQYDLNADGAIDLVFCNTHDTVEKLDALIYWGRSGRYSAARVGHIATDGAYFSLVEDLDNDGWPDLVITNRDNGITTVLQSFIYWGGPDGYSCLRRSEIQTFNPGRCLAADLDGNGFKDLIVPNGVYRLGATRFDDVGVRIHWGSVRGFTDYDIQDIGCTNVSCVAVGRLAIGNRSGVGPPDLFVGVRKGKSLILRSNGHGLDEARPIRLECESITQAIVVNYDGDSYDDLLINSGPGNSVRLVCGGGNGVSAALQKDLGVNGGQAMQCGDLDGDGLLDLVVAGTSPKQSVIYWRDAGGYSADRVTPIDTSHASDVCVADLNGDGHLDVVLAQQMNQDTFDVDTLILWGDGTRDIGSRSARLEGRGIMGVSVGDLNRDGDIDVVLTGRIGGTRTGRVPSYVYWNDGQGRFGSDNRTSLITSDNYEAAAADLNLDGYADLIFAEEYETQGEIGESHIFWGGREGFRQDRCTGLMTHGAMGVSVADLNRDGHLDIVFGQLDRVPLTADHRDRLPSFYLDMVFAERRGMVKGRQMSRIFWGGDAGFSIRSMTELQTTGAGTPAIADFNRDGWLDLVFPNLMDNSGAWVYWGGSDGFDQRRSQRICFERGGKAEAVDLNGDGWLDLIIVIRVKGLSKDTYSLVYLGDPEGLSEKRRLKLPTRGAGAPSASDLNRDGRLDVFITNYTSDATRQIPSYLYWGSDEGWTSMNRAELPAHSGNGNLIADFNADGWPDIAIACHRREGSRDLPGYPNAHVAESYVYWGSAEGFDVRRRLELPTVGPHGMLGIDAGHVYHRRPEWIYTSSAHDLGNLRPAVAEVEWDGKTPDGTSIALQLRSADSEGDLAQAEWIGPSGPGSWFVARNEATIPSDRSAFGRWVQYRVRFRSERCALYPTLERVEIGFK